MDTYIERALYMQPAPDDFTEKATNTWHMARRREYKALRPPIVDKHLTPDG